MIAIEVILIDEGRGIVETVCCSRVINRYQDASSIVMSNKDKNPSWMNV